MTDYEKEYFTNGGYRPMVNYPNHLLRAQKIIKIARPQSVLDVGCAYGYVTMYLQQLGLSAMGCDVSKWCEEQAARIIPNSYKRCPAWQLDFDDGQFDLIYCEGVLEHLPEDKINDVFKEFQRVGKRFYLALAFAGREGVDKTEGHLCIHDIQWWFERMPDYSWLYGGPGCSAEGNQFIYKG